MYYRQQKTTSGILVAVITAFSNKGLIFIQQVTAQPKTKCNPVGLVVVSGDRQVSPGSILCEGDKLNILPGREVKVSCFNPERKFSGTSAIVCSEGQDEIGERNCFPGNKSNCHKQKGAGEANKPVLTNPYSRVLIDDRPTLKWNPVIDATSYTVYLSGKNVDWAEKVESTKLPYPINQPGLQYGNTYKIVVVANRGDSSINDSVAAVSLLSKDDIEQLQKTAKQIEDLNLPKNEEAFYLDSLYMSKSLIDKSIELLKSQIAQSQDPRLHRILGDRYFEAGVTTLAQWEYQQAEVLAKNQQDQVELSKAKAGLSLIARYNQLPTKTKPAQ